MLDVIYCRVLNKIMPDEDVQVLFDVVYVVEFLLVVILYSMHYYQWVYQVNGPIEIKELSFTKIEKECLQLFLVVLSFAAVTVGLEELNIN